MASPTIFKAKVSSSAKAKPVASSSATPRVVVRGPSLDTLSVSRPVASAPSTPVLQPRVTAKVTGAARPKPAISTPGQSPHTLPRPRTSSTSSRPAISRARTGSVYSLSAVSQPTHHALRPQSPVRSVVSAGARVHYLGSAVSTGPHSPPTSVLSIQSASTSSMTSASTAASVSTNSPISPKPPHAVPIVRARITATSARSVSPARLTLPDSEDDNVDLNALSSDSDDDDDNASTKTGSSSLDPAMEAKVNRKIADLEITNASLLTINASLEALKARQQKEIWDLRRKLRETRLALPPPVFAALKDKDTHADEPEEEEDEVETLPDPDPAFERLSALVQGLLDDARAALSASVAPVKVLSAHEVRAWEGRRFSSSGDGKDDGGGGGGGGVGKEEGVDEDVQDEHEVTVMLDRTPSPS